MDRSIILDQSREVIRATHLSSNTEKCYINWIFRFLVFHNKILPERTGENEITEFLTYLNTKRKLSVSTQNQALDAIEFLFLRVFKIPPENFCFKHAKINGKLPIIFNGNEVHQILLCLHGEFHLMASLLYGSGLRLTECLKLRIKDIDFELQKINVQNDKGGIDRRTLLPHKLIPELKRQIEKTKIKFEENILVKEFFGTTVPETVEQENPDAAKMLGWQYIFPAVRLEIDRSSGMLKQHYRNESYLQKEFKKAMLKAQIAKKASCNTLRHSFATQLIENGYDIRTVQELLGHKNIHSTLKYTHIVGRKTANVRSPLDQ